MAVPDGRAVHAADHPTLLSHVTLVTRGMDCSSPAVSLLNTYLRLCRCLHISQSWLSQSSCMRSTLMVGVLAASPSRWCRAEQGDDTIYGPASRSTRYLQTTCQFIPQDIHADSFRIVRMIKLKSAMTKLPSFWWVSHQMKDAVII